MRKVRYTAFQSCITLGGLHLAKMGQNNGFLPLGTQNFKSIASFYMVPIREGWGQSPPGLTVSICENFDPFSLGI